MPVVPCMLLCLGCPGEDWLRGNGVTRSGCLLMCPVAALPLWEVCRMMLESALQFKTCSLHGP